MCKTPNKMHMRDMVTIDAIVFEIIGGWGGGAFKAPRPGSLTFSNTPDRIGLIKQYAIRIVEHWILYFIMFNDFW